MDFPSPVAFPIGAVEMMMLLPIPPKSDLAAADVAAVAAADVAMMAVAAGHPAAVVPSGHTAAVVGLASCHLVNPFHM